MDEKKYELIFCIVNAGFSETVMDAAKAAGARGGTLLRGRGTANREAEEFFHITIQPEKEVVMMLVPEEVKDNVLRSIYTTCGLESDANGIAFSLPVTKAVGLTESAKTE